jgi:hypothetical protein
MVGMGWRMNASVPVRMLLAFSLAVLCLPFAAPAEKNSDTAPKADLRIPVGPLGYVAPSSFYLTSRLSSISLDFIDKDHLLFTFHLPGLMTRTPDDPATDEDQTIRAIVIALPDGKVLSKTEWRMHDRWRYLWHLSNGKFLVRQRNTLSITDDTLELHPYLNTDFPIQSVQLSPDCGLVVVETEGKKETQTLASTADVLADPTPETKPIHIFVLRTESRAMIAHSEALNPISLPMLGEGYLQALATKQDRWMIRYYPFHGEDPHPLTEIESSCHPTEETVSKDVSLVIGCPRSSNDHMVSAVSSDGKTLWQQRWESRYIWPTFQLARDGSRFAYSSLQVNHPVGTMDPVDQTSIVNQMVGVFDTKTGQLRLVKNATPILSAGQNYALSPDGSRFVILRDDAIEVYDLPPAPSVDAAPATPSAGH